MLPAVLMTWAVDTRGTYKTLKEENVFVFFGVWLTPTNLRTVCSEISLVIVCVIGLKKEQALTHTGTTGFYMTTTTQLPVTY